MVSSLDIFHGFADGFSSSLTYEGGFPPSVFAVCKTNTRKKAPEGKPGPVAAEVSGSLSTDLGRLGAWP